MEDVACGLKSKLGDVALKGVQIKARINGLCSEVTVSQRYRNEEQVDVEAVYVFPLEESAAVSGFEATVGGKTIKGRVEAKDKAFETYDDAMMEGHGAFLLDQERPNIFTASVGNLRAGQEATISISYVATLSREGQAVRVMIPTTVSPRYVPTGAEVKVGQPEGERVNPPRRLEVPYGMTLEVQLAMGGQIKSIESPSHPIRTQLDGAEALVTLSHHNAAMDSDFVLLVEAASEGPSCQVAQESDGTRVAMVTFKPDEGDLAADTPTEVVFLLDCSGSMQGSSIHEARRALALSLRALSEGDRFNLICFGSTFKKMWPESRPFDQKNLDEASAYLERVDASLGGTEILAPLKAIADTPVPANFTRQVLLLTDGQVSNEPQVIALSGQMAGTRVFAFGIGAGASEHLVRGMARASKGAAEFIAPGERVEPKVLRMSNRLHTPSLSGIRVDWGELAIQQAPASIPAVFAGDTVTVFAKIESGNTSEVRLIAGDKTWTATIDLEHAQKKGPIPKLWARKRIQELEERRDNPKGGSNQRRESREVRINKEIVSLAVAYGLMSSQTSYVAIETREGQELSDGSQLRKIPVALTTQWGGAPRFGFGGLPRGGATTGTFAPPSPMLMAAAPLMSKAAMSPRARYAPPPAPPSAPSPAPRKKKRGASLFSEVMDFFTSPPDEMEAEREEEAAHDLSAQDQLFALLLTQKADGRFPMSAALQNVLAGRGPDASATDELATAATVAVIKSDFPGEIASWTAAITKAERWLSLHAPSLDVTQVL